MDIATQLVQAYLHLNGYFTVVEYPLVETVRRRGSRAVTDFDMLAVRFPGPGAARQDKRRREIAGPVSAEPDPALSCPHDSTDMIVAEIKQGKARVNPATRDPAVLAAGLMRFGCCTAQDAPEVVRSLLQKGHATTGEQHVVRMLLFASSAEGAPAGWKVIRIGQAMTFISSYLESHWASLGHLDLGSTALGWLALLHKCELEITSKDIEAPGEQCHE